MKLYIGFNGDASAKMVLFAPNEQTAHILAQKRIEDEELEDVFPVIDFEEHEVVEGVIEVFEDSY